MVNKGLGKFKTIFILSLLKAVIITSFYSYFLFFINNIQIELIVFANIFSALIPFLINLSIIIVTLFSLKNTQEKGSKYKEVFKEIMNYGSFITIQALINKYWKEIKTQSIGAFISSNLVVGYTISKRYSEVCTLSIQSLNDPFIVSLSSLDTKKDFKTISKIFQISFKYSFFFISLITGTLIFLGDFFLFFIYGESYLIYSTLLKLFLISIIFNPLGNLFMIFLKATNRVRIIPLLEIGLTIIRIITFYTGLIYFGIYGMMIGIIINRFLIFTLYCFLSKKILKIKLDYLKALKQAFIFFSSLIITMFLGELVLNNLNYSILSILRLTYFKYFNIFNLISFLIIFLTLNFVFKIITKMDIEYIESLFIKEKLTYKFIRIVLKQIKKITR
ncbi:MAG: lipopolysaccharide biosynthesis protein [Promethearchaeota archaeon]